jgi:Flp pilus assembly pilin Flp
MTLIRRLIADDRGQDLVEYILLGTLVGLASLLLANVMPGVMNAVYVSWDSATQYLWYPDAPQ